MRETAGRTGRTGRRFAIWGLSLALVVVGAGIALAFSAGKTMGAAYRSGGPTQSETEERTFVVAGVPTFALAGDNGPVTITRGDSDTAVIVRVTKRGASDEELRRLRVEMTQNGDAISVREGGANRSFSFGRRGSVEYAVQLPRRANIAPLRTDHGAVSVSGIAGNLDLETDNGSIIVRDFDGTLAARTDNGRVTLANGVGSVRVVTDNGSVDLRDVRAAGLNVRTDNGRVGFAGSLAPGSDTRIETNNGSVTVQLPPESGFALDAESHHGRVQVAFPVTRSPAPVGSRGYGDDNDREAIRGTVGRPDATLTVRTGNGGITIAHGNGTQGNATQATPTAVPFGERTTGKRGYGA